VRPLNFTVRRHHDAHRSAGSPSVKDALITSSLTVAIFLGLILFEMGAKYRILVANPYNEGSFRVAPSIPRYIAVLAIATFIALQVRHHQLPYWSAVGFGIAFVAWWAFLLWDVGKEMVRQRKAREARDGVS